MIYEIKNYLIYAFHAIYRQPPSTPFKGTLPEAKAKAREILRDLGLGWTVKVGTDGQTIYCEETRG